MKKKKALKILLGTSLVLLALLIGIPLFLEAKIGPILKRKINAEIQGNFDFREAGLSLIRNFPNARVTLEDLKVTTIAPFEGDTLLFASEAYLVMDIGELFRGEGAPIGIRELQINGADLRLEVNAAEQANYLIAGPGEAAVGEASANTEGFSFKLEKYGIEDSRIAYRDASSGISFFLDQIAHEGSGDLSLSDSKLQTQTRALMSLTMDSVEYLRQNSLELEALIGVDLQTDTYTFLQNEGHINQMAVVFDGSVQLLDDGQQIDLHFQTPSSDFKNFLALIPEAYSKDLENVSTTGQFSLQGDIAGRSDDTRIPEFAIRMEAVDAAFRYPDLPKGIDAINFTAQLLNTSGNTADTFLEISKAAFRIDQDTFSMNGKVTSLTGNPDVDVALKGTVNLANLDQAYPVDLIPGIKGILKVDLKSAFDMAAVESERYQDTRTSGSMQVSNLQIKTEYFVEPLKINEGSLRFNPGVAQLEKLSGSLGESDFELRGSVRDYLGYLLSDGSLRGDFTLKSNRLKVADFTGPTAADPSETTDSQPESGSDFQIPQNIDCTIRGQAGMVLYGDLPLRNVSGQLLVRDQQLRIMDVSSNALDGRLALNGMLATGQGPPRFNMDLGIDGFRIRETLEVIELFETLAPIAAIIEGKFNSKVRLSGLLQQDFSPDLASLAGNVVAEVLASEVTGNRAKVLEALDTRLGFFDVEDLNLKGLKTVLDFENGQVRVKPFDFTYKDIAVQVSGSHSFDQQLKYTATLKVPAKYLGKNVNRLLTEIAEPDLQETTIPVVANIGGSYREPTVETDLQAAVTDLTSRLIEVQKQKLTAAGKEKARDLIGSLLKESGDTTRIASDSTKTGIQGVLDGVLSDRTKESSKSKSDSTPKEGESVQKAARNILGGLLGRKKDSTSTVKDSTRKNDKP